MNYSKLKGRIIEVFGSQTSFAESINKDNAYVSRVLNSKSYLNQKDIVTWASALGIPDTDIGSFFCTLKVDKTQN